ncbi:MAG: hypothetical protein PVI01_02845 [Gemmatimonadales bacterium]|jgi:tetratricopeptide (TPR) repeat protein
MRPTIIWTVIVLLAGSAGRNAAPQEARLGTIDFPSSGAPEAQPHFIRGVLYLHSFEYSHAADAFREAQRLDPDFAMAYWGEAMTYNHPVWNQKDVDAARAALARLAPTPEARQAKAPTQREKDYLAAVEVLYGEGAKAERDTAYSLAMKDLMDAYPEDDEAKAFYALSLLGLSQGVRDVPTYMKAAAVAQQVFRANPDHPGAVHYLIHSFDDPVHAPLGLPAARAYSKIAPAAPHAQHMTTHIFVALGMWDEVVSQNEIATGDHWLPGHYTYWLAYGLLQQGRHSEALALLEKIAGNMRADAPDGRRGYLASMRAQHLVNTESWESPTARWELDLAGLSGGSRARDAFATGFAALRSGDRSGAESALASLAVIEKEPREWGSETVPRILESELRAALAMANGDAERATGLMEAATAMEDAMPFEFGPPVVVKPSHELFGEILLELDRPAKAQAEFQRALQLAPKRALSLLGLARAAKAAGDAATAQRAYETLSEVWQRADPGIPGLSEARRVASVRE